MGTLRIHPGRLGQFSGRAVSNFWGVFDVQLAIFALGLTVIGVLIAFTNSQGAPLQPGSVFTRALLWVALGIVAFTIAAARSSDRGSSTSMAAGISSNGRSANGTTTCAPAGALP